MDITVFAWLICLFIAGCIIAVCVRTFKKKREEKRRSEYTKFMKEHYIIMEGL